MQTLEQNAGNIKNAAMPEEYQKLVAKVAELKSRKALSLRKADVRTFVAKARRNADLRRAPLAFVRRRSLGKAQR